MCKWTWSPHDSLLGASSDLWNKVAQQVSQTGILNCQPYLTSSLSRSSCGVTVAAWRTRRQRLVYCRNLLGIHSVKIFFLYMLHLKDPLLRPFACNWSTWPQGAFMKECGPSSRAPHGHDMLSKIVFQLLTLRRTSFYINGSEKECTFNWTKPL